MNIFDFATHHNRQLVTASIVGLVVLLLWHILSPAGLLEYSRTASRLHGINTDNYQLEQKNQTLIAEIARLENDDQYLSGLARRQHNLIRRNELIFDFSRTKR